MDFKKILHIKRTYTLYKLKKYGKLSRWNKYESKTGILYLGFPTDIEMSFFKLQSI